MSELNQPASQNIESGKQEHAPCKTKPCTACQTAGTAGAKFCPQCGRKLTGENHDTVVQPKEPPVRVSSAELPVKIVGETKPAPLIQEKTTSTVQDPASFIQFEAPKELTPCSCGRYMPPEARFCYHCGIQIKPAQGQHKLICTGKNGVTEIVGLSQKDFTIGKSADCGLVIPNDDYVSRQHARLTQADEQVFLEDLNSSNGTFLRVRSPVALKSGDEFLVGTNLIRFE